MIDEIHYLRGELEKREQISVQDNRKPAANKPSLLERVDLEEKKEVESDQTMNQAGYESTSKSSPNSESLSSTNTRRTWRGML